MSIDLFQYVTECGCAAKVPAQALSSLLSHVELPSSPQLLIGPETLDDAGVYQLSTGQCLVQTVDFFPPVSRDPRLYGQIATANALSDIFAMGARPITALAVVCLPSNLVEYGVLDEIIRGSVEKLQEAGAVLLGGHSVLDPQLKFGLAVTGLADGPELLTNSRACPGDILVLTKPLGTGVTIMAVRAGMTTIEQEKELYRVMAELNQKAASLALRHQARSATDITGFGLLGHALQLARASSVSLELNLHRIPLLEGALGFAEQGLLSAAAYSNRAYVRDAVSFDPDVKLAEQDLLCDPQTSGGLLICCPASGADKLLASAREEFGLRAAIVGTVVEPRGASRICVHA